MPQAAATPRKPTEEVVQRPWGRPVQSARESALRWTSSRQVQMMKIGWHYNIIRNGIAGLTALPTSEPRYVGPIHDRHGDMGPAGALNRACPESSQRDRPARRSDALDGKLASQVRRGGRIDRGFRRIDPNRPRSGGPTRASGPVSIPFCCQDSPLVAPCLRRRSLVKLDHGLRFLVGQPQDQVVAGLIVK